jgi:hypothetical protein
MNQRWRNHRTLYRPAGEVIRPADYEVAAIHSDHEAKAFVLAHHAFKTYPAARFRFGLYRHGQLVGVAVFSHPCNDLVLTRVFRCDPTLAVELGRFVLLDSVPGNGESWFLGGCFTQLRRFDLVGVLTFSDPVPRRNVAGDIVVPGHLGTVFQAHNGVYVGPGTARTLRLLPDGRVLSDRAIQKIRSGEPGWRYAAAALERFGASPVSEDRRAWLAEWLPRLTRPLPHPGNYRYAWPLNRTARRLMPAGLPYPKWQPLFWGQCDSSRR